MAETHRRFVEVWPRSAGLDAVLEGLVGPLWRFALYALYLSTGRSIPHAAKQTTGVSFGYCDAAGELRPKAEATHVGWTLDPLYDPPRIAWSEPYEPMSFGVSCAKQPGNPSCHPGPASS